MEPNKEIPVGEQSPREKAFSEGPVPASGIGSAEAAQPTYSNVAREKMVEVSFQHQRAANDAKALLEMLNEHPELDESVCRLFGITAKVA